MESTELRIGNLFFAPSGGPVKMPGHIPMKVYEILFGEVSFLMASITEPWKEPKFHKIRLSEVSPIPLTSEWLERLGFVEDRNGYRLPDLNSLSLTQTFRPCWMDKVLLRSELKSVHQLQNLYFALTGEELTIKETVKG